MIRITVDKSAIRAISHFLSEDDIRYCLNGMLLEADASSMRLVATNGHMLGALRLQYADGDIRPTELVEAIIPADLIKSVKKPRQKESLTLFVSIDGDMVTFTDGATTQSAKLIDAKFPNWRNIMPKSISGEVSQFNTAYIWAFTEAQRDLGSKLQAVTISHNGDSAALVTIAHQEFIGVIMPIRTAAPLTAAPDWVFTAMEAA